MNFRKLNIFYETAQCLNMTKVAKQLYISQPSISQAISELEEELEVRLFDRIGKKLYLTYEGEIYLTYVRRILNLQKEGLETIKSYNCGKKGKIIIGASTTIGTYILPNIIKKFNEKYKEIDISLIIENTEHIEVLLLENKIDFAFVEGSVNAKEILVEKIWDDKLIFVANNDNELVKRNKPELSELKNNKIVMREAGSGTRKIVEGYLKSNNIDYNIAMEIGNSEAIASIVEAGLGVACISYKCVEDKLNAGRLKKIDFKDFNLRRDLYFIKHNDKILSSNMELFVNEIKKLYRII